MSGGYEHRVDLGQTERLSWAGHTLDIPLHNQTRSVYWNSSMSGVFALGETSELIVRWLIVASGIPQSGQELGKAVGITPHYADVIASRFRENLDQLPIIDETVPMSRKGAHAGYALNPLNNEPLRVWFRGHKLTETEIDDHIPNRPKEHIVTWDGYLLKIRYKTLTIPDKVDPFPLSQKELAIVTLLLQARGELVTYPLLEGTNFPSYRAFKQRIYHLRRKLDPKDHDKYIGSNPGLGFFLKPVS